MTKEIELELAAQRAARLRRAGWFALRGEPAAARLRPGRRPTGWWRRLAGRIFSALARPRAAASQQRVADGAGLPPFDRSPRATAAQD